MTPDEHQRERMRLWSTSYTGNFVDGHPPGRCCDFADAAVAEFDKRFPAPVAPAAIRDTRLRADIPATELTTLRDKARLWDAVASRKVRLTCDFQGMFAALFDKGEQVGGWQTSFYTTAAEAVQAAIDAGALK